MGKSGLRRSALAFASSASLLGAMSIPSHADDFTLRIGAGHPAVVADYIQVAQQFLMPEISRRVAERTEHTVRFQEAWAGSVAGLNEILGATQQGILDIGLIVVMFDPARLFAQNFTLAVPFTTPDAAQHIRAVQRVYDEFPVLAGDYEQRYGQKQIALCGGGNYQLATNFAWESVADLEGHKIGAAGPNLPWLEGTGITGVQASLNEAYTSIQTGAISGYLMFPDGYAGAKLYEVAPYYSVLDFGSMVHCAVTLSQRTIDRLPAEVVEIIEEVGREYQDVWGEAANANHEQRMSSLQEAGAELVEVSQEVREEWAKRIADLPNRRAREMNERGYPGTEIMQAYIRALEEDGHSFPVDFAFD